MADKPDNPDKKNIWSRIKRILLAPFRRSEAGDVIVANVGEGAQNVVIGKDIIQIGTLEVPAVPVIISLVVLALVAALGLWLALVPNEMPTNRFNIAVTEFGQLDVQGQVNRSEDGQALSEWVFMELEKEYTAFPKEIDRPVVWHDSLGFLKERIKLGPIEGSTPEERAEAAADLAQKIGANLIIYGYFSASGSPNADQRQFTPEFYLKEIANEADEMVGPHQLGAPIGLQLPLDPNDLTTSQYLERQLGPRTDLLIWFTQGLVLDLGGYHADAFNVFEQAEAQLQSLDTGQGAEVHYYFKGREALFLGREDATWLEQAEEAFTRALNANPQYARAHIGLGGVYYERAQQLPPDLRMETGDLTQAIDEYTKAVEKGPASPGTQIELKGRLGLGTAYRLQGETFLHLGQNDEAAQAYGKAIAQLEAVLPLVNVDYHRLLAQGYLALGAAYQGQGHALLVQAETEQSQLALEKAQAAYAACITQADQEPYDTFLQRLKDNRCLPYQESVIQALTD